MKRKTATILIILLAIFFSFFRLENFYHFDYDQERDYQAVKAISEGKITLIGPRAVAATGFYLGPYYYYLLFPFHLLSAGNPIYLAFVASTTITLTGLLIFFYLQKKNSVLIAFAATLLWVSFPRRTSWNVMFVPAFSVFLAYLFTLKPNSKNLSIAALTLGLAINFHFQMVIFLVPLLYLCLKHLKPKEFPKVAISFLLPFAPLVLFDLRHDFINTKSAINFLTASSGVEKDLLSQFKFSLRNFVRESHFFIFKELPPGFTLALFLPSFYLFYKHKKDQRHLLLVPLVSLIVLGFYSNPRWPEYYHLSAVTIAYLILFTTLKSDQLNHLLIFILVFLIVNQNTSFLLNNHDAKSYLQKRQLMQYILDDSSPQNPNIKYEFKFGEGLGFGSIRDYYQNDRQGFTTHTYFVSDYNNKKQIEHTKKIFGQYAVSKLY